MMRILIVRLGSLGDLVHALPAVSAIAEAHPDTEIDWLVDAVHRDFLALVPMISLVVPLRDRTAAAWLEARRVLRSRHYDVALDFQGLLKSAALARLSGASRVIGFDRQSLRERAAAPFYTERVDVGDAAEATQHVIDKNLRLATAIGAVIAERRFPLVAPESPALRQLQALGLDGFMLINPSAAWPNKRWPTASFGSVAAYVHGRHGRRSVVLWGPGEAMIAQAVVDASSGTGLVAPPTTIADLVALSRRASLFLSGDTGPLHLAAAVGTPVVGLFGPTSPGRNGPWDARDVSLSRYDACVCHYQRRCHQPDNWCLATITVDEVTAAIDARLGKPSE
jgi:heptosyltransferase I